MRASRLLCAAAAAFLAVLPARADQILGGARIDGSNRIVLPGGPTLGLWQAGKYIAQPDSIQIQGSGSTGEVSETSVTAGGATKTLQNWLTPGTAANTFAAGNDQRIPTPDTAGNSPILGPDGGTTARLGFLPAVVSLEYARILPGNSGVGGTMLCERPTSPAASVRCNLVAQGAGGHLFGNANGVLGSFIDGGSLTSAYLMFSPGTTGNGSVSTIGTSTYGHIYIVAGTTGGTSPGGIGLGSNNLVANGVACIAANNGSQCRGVYNFSTGNQASDFATMIGSRVHSSAPVSGGAIGSNQFAEQTLQATITDASTKRLNYNGGGTYTSGTSASITPNGHGTFRIEAECSKISTGDSAVWFVQGSFTRLSSTSYRLPYTTGTGAPAGGDAGLSTMSLSVAADSSNGNFNISITPPAGNSASIGCTAIIRYQQRVS